MKAFLAATSILAICFFANCMADGGVCTETGFVAQNVNVYKVVKDRLLSRVWGTFYSIPQVALEN